MKINYDRPKKNSSAINKNKDFNELQKLHLASTLPFYKQIWFISALASLPIIALIFLFFYTKTNLVPYENNAQKVTKNTEQIIKKIDKQIAYLEDTPCIKPSSKKLTIPFQLFKINPNKNQTIAFNQAKLTLPSNCFLDSENNIIKDSIILKFKVMNDPVDFILSGIPMEYDSSGQIYTFESGGMIEIKGTDFNNKPITIRKDRPLSINFDIDESDEPFNFYNLDTVNQKWNYITNKTLALKTMPFEADKTHNFDKEDWKLKYKEQNIANQKWKRAEKEVNVHKKTKPNAPAKVKDIQHTFTLDIDRNQFPELRSFSKQKFEPIYVSKVDKSIYTTEWTSIKLREHKKGISYQIILRNNSDIKTLIAEPVYEGEDWAKAQHLYSDKFSKYTTILDQKEEKELMLKEDYEKKKKHFDNIDKLKNIVKTITKTVSRTLVAPIIFFGIHNFDRPLINRPKTTILPDNKDIKIKEQPKFVDLNGNDLQFEKIYLIEDKRNASFSYNLKTSNYFSYNEKSEISIIGFNGTNELVLIDKTSFKEAINSNSSFIGKVMPNTTIDELKRLILNI